LTRGRRPARAIQLANGIAEKRGEVQHCRHGPGMICTFLIYLAGLVAHVRIKRMRHLRCTTQWLEREAADELAGLRIIASSPAISRELWICSPRGNFRFFRVLEDSLVELDRDGRLLPAQASGKKRRKVPAVPASTGNSGNGSEAPELPAFPAEIPIRVLPAGNPEPARIPEVSVGEHTPPDHKGRETP
jgi:hypothetical protein